MQSRYLFTRDKTELVQVNEALFFFSYRKTNMLGGIFLAKILSNMLIPPSTPHTQE